MLIGQTLTIDAIDQIGTTITFSAGEAKHTYQGLLMKHVCRTPQPLRVGDVVVVKTVGPNDNLTVQLGCGCVLFLYGRRHLS